MLIDLVPMHYVTAEEISHCYHNIVVIYARKNNKDEKRYGDDKDESYVYVYTNCMTPCCCYYDCLMKVLILWPKQMILLK